MPLSPSDPIGHLGNGHEVDSLAACAHAALRSWGRKVAYDCVAGLSGSAFSPAFRPGETCAGWCMESANDSRLEFVGHALGFSVERSPGDSGSWPRFAQRAHAALADGAAVLCRTWPCWCLISAWSDDPDRLGIASPQGLEDKCRADAGSVFYVLRPAEPALTRCEALREALRFGAAVATGGHEGPDCEYGGRLYDAWLERLAGDEFCPDCGEDGWHCAERLASRTQAGQTSAAHFLSRAQAFLPILSTDPSAGEAAGSYGIMADTLAPYTWGSGMNTTLRDPDRRRQYLLDVQRVRDLHDRAAEHLARVACRL